MCDRPAPLPAPPDKCAGPLPVGGDVASESAMPFDPPEPTPLAPAPSASTPRVRVSDLFAAARAALTFLTRLPLGGYPISPAVWRWCAAFFPFAGLVVGAAMGAAFALTRNLGAAPAAWISVIGGLFLTGAFHEDGLADTADALGGASTRARLFEILKDSRIGTFGAVALIGALGLRVSLLARLDADAPVALLVSQTLSRVPPVWLMRVLPYVTPAETARSKPLAVGGTPQALVATFIGMVTAWCAWRGGRVDATACAVLPLSLMAVALVCGWRWRARAGGLTGDFLGATQQSADLAVLVVLTATQAHLD